MNRAVIEAMTQSGETAESLASRVGVDPKTAARWASHGRIPQTRHRAQVAMALGRDVLESVAGGAAAARAGVVPPVGRHRA